MVHIGGDGNCLFRAISYNLFGHEDAHFSLRSIIERFETCNSSIFEKRMTMVNESTFAEHLKQLYRPNTWATHIEVFAIATYFQAPVYFCADPPHPKRGVYCWERYMPVASVENLSYPYVIEPPFDAKISVNHFEIVYHIGYHYDSTGTLCWTPPLLTENIIHETNIIEKD